MSSSLAQKKLDIKATSICVVDSSTVEQEFVAQVLMGFGANAITRVSTVDELLRNTTTPYELLLISADADGGASMDGVRALRRAEDHRSRLAPIIVFSSHTARPMVDKARNSGANFVMVKPISPKALFDRILWLSITQKDFVETEDYVGPDRRVRNFGPPGETAGRRSTDLSAEVGAPSGEDMSQADIDALLKPVRARQ
jgi:CheY-like chemotaxis protein